MNRFGLQPLASGSSGNETLVHLEGSYALVDIGLNCKQTKLLLADAAVSPERIGAILITHEHSDHIRGLAVFCKHFKPLLYMTEGTAQAVFTEERPENLRTFQAGESFVFEGTEIDSLKTSHDGAEPCGYRFRRGNRMISVVTDTGKPTADVKKAVATSEVLLLESNHDAGMLQTGPYPYFLKRRIASNKGHLSNAVASKLVADKAGSHLRQLILGHLSKENNHPDLALETMTRTIESSGLECRIHCAPPRGPMPLFAVDGDNEPLSEAPKQIDWMQEAQSPRKRNR